MPHDFHTREATLAPGHYLTDRLQVIRELGRGGLGTVYEVEHKFTKHRRAVKVLHPQFRRDASVVERFLREASAASRIGNPHIVETFDAGYLEDGSPFIVMELLSGRALNELLKARGRLAPADASGLLTQVCAAMQAAHDADIIHRDLKPENLFVTLRDGSAFVKVLDFGISKFHLDEEEALLSSTRSGMTMGTPLYMSPEQLRGAKNADARSDVYSLGVILYQMVVGKAPFEAESFPELMVKILTLSPTPIPEGAFETELSRGLGKIVGRAICKDPQERFQSAQALSEALEPFRRGAQMTLLLTVEPRLSDTHIPSNSLATPSPASPEPQVRPEPSVAAPVPSSPEALSSHELALVQGKRRPLWLAGVAGAALLAAFAAVRSADPPQPEPVVVSPPAPLLVAPPPPAPVVPAVAAAPAPPPPPPVVPAVAIAAPSAPVVAPVAMTGVAPARAAAPAERLRQRPVPALAVGGPGLAQLGCSPSACTVQVDDRAVGETPILELELSAGAHTARFTNAETKTTTTRRFDITPGATTKVNVSW